jgi:hypothetical protein
MPYNPNTVFYAPLAVDASDKIAGNDLIPQSAVYQTVDGVACAKIYAGSYYTSPAGLLALISGLQTGTIEYLIYYGTIGNAHWNYVAEPYWGMKLNATPDGGTNSMYMQGAERLGALVIGTGAWRYLGVTFTSTAAKLYTAPAPGGVVGTVSLDGSYSMDGRPGAVSSFTIGAFVGGIGAGDIAYMAGYRISNIVQTLPTVDSFPALDARRRR